MLKRTRRPLAILLGGLVTLGAFGAAPAALAQPIEDAPEVTCEAAPQDVAILLDTTGSMSGAITAAQETAVSAANTISAAGGRVALVQYKDSGDSIVAQTASDFTDDAAAFQAATQTLSARGGGDSPEAALFALNHTLTSLAWTPGAARAVILITDETFHDPDVADPTLTAASVTAALSASHTQVFPLLTGSAADRKGQYTALAAATGGFVTSLTSSSTIEEILERVIGEVVARPWVAFSQPSYSTPEDAPVQLSTVSGADCAPLEVASWNWSFIDGTPAVEAEPAATATASYATPGTYAVTVTVTTPAGAKASASTSVVVTEAPSPTTTTTPSATSAPPSTSGPTRTPDPAGPSAPTLPTAPAGIPGPAGVSSGPVSSAPTASTGPAGRNAPTSTSSSSLVSDRNPTAPSTGAPTTAAPPRSTAPTSTASTPSATNTATAAGPQATSDTPGSSSDAAASGPDDADDDSSGWLAGGAIALIAGGLLVAGGGATFFLRSRET